MSLTVTPPASLPKLAAVPGDPIWRLSVEQYHEMIRTGILEDGDPVELLEGWLVVKMSKSPQHCVATQLTRLALERLISSGWFVNTQDPVTTDDSEPEPDVSVIRGDRWQYLERHPGPQEVALVVEVADSSLARDRAFKRRLYAAARIPAYWVLNLVERQLEVYTDPTGPAEAPDYRQRQVFAPSEEVPLIIDGSEVGRLPVGELLP
jgi:Uma2 family endonuclease